MSTVKDQMQADLTTAMKARDTLRSSTLRMVLTAIKAEEVAGTEARELSDEEVMRVLTREAKKRREAATAYDEAGRTELATQERDELEILQAYLPQQLSESEVSDIVAAEVAQAAADGATGMAAMGKVMKAVQGKVAGRADGGAVAAEVKRQLSGA